MANETEETGTNYELKLFVSGASPNSVKAISNLRQICEEHLKEKYTLEIIDVYQDRAQAGREQIVALPLLVRKSPLPEKKLIGNLSNVDKVLHGLGLLHK